MPDLTARKVTTETMLKQYFGTALLIVHSRIYRDKEFTAS